jgi:hypothetical protein
VSLCRTGDDEEIDGVEVRSYDDLHRFHSAAAGSNYTTAR